ncbi:MAG: long-chain-fatty-acid--CoA ligase [Hydrogenophilaceae bacterium]|jgi:acyl-CoA synthetase (AMP-forming)/AMP-acid ligase II|nr:long-chain-fatty-acid--CoA ligase [Hydrogenophilaceae bacterium]
MIDLTGVAALADVARRQAERRPHALALKDGGYETTYAQLDAHSNRVADRMLVEGLKPGDRVAVLSKNCDFFYEIWFGAMKARAALAGVNFRLAPPEIAYIIDDSEAKLLFVGEDFYALAEAALAQMKTRPKLIALDGERPGYVWYESWRAQGSAIDPMLKGADDDVVLQLYTSGTTGHPKGVEISNANMIAVLSLAHGVAGFNYAADDNVINAMPQFHVAGTNIGIVALASGARLHILRDLIPAQIIAMIEREKINHAFFVPAVILMLMQAPEMAAADLSSVRTVSYGASPIAEDLLIRARDRFKCSFLQFYGMTETCGAGTHLPPEAHDPARNKLRSCGIPWPGVDVKVVDANGNECKTGEVGEIVIKAPIVMKGYWKRPDATAEAVKDGWMHTGDAAYKDEEGYFFIYDRVKDMIVSGGENIYPAEVENAIFSHPDVADVAVIGVPDDKWGESVKAIVILKPGAAADPDSIIAHTRERLAGYKVPKTVDFVDAIPRNASGKILRRELRKPYWEGRGRMVG